VTAGRGNWPDTRNISAMFQARWLAVLAGPRVPGMMIGAPGIRAKPGLPSPVRHDRGSTSAGAHGSSRGRRGFHPCRIQPRRVCRRAISILANLIIVTSDY